jgi:hypothetical protein
MLWSCDQPQNIDLALLLSSITLDNRGIMLLTIVTVTLTLPPIDGLIDESYSCPFTAE